MRWQLQSDVIRPHAKMDTSLRRPGFVDISAKQVFINSFYNSFKSLSNFLIRSIAEGSICICNQCCAACIVRSRDYIVLSPAWGELDDLPQLLR